MPTKPRQVTLTNSSVDILNAIRNSASTNYRDYVPIATPNAESIREIGAVIMNNPTLQNEFVPALINRIAKVLVTSETYDNPWSSFKKGFIELGETVEEVFVNIAKPFQYNPENAESTFMKRELPDIRSAFHIMNYKKFYKDTIQRRDLQQAFLSWEGIYDLVAKIVESMVTGANYDEFLVMKYMLAKRILKGQMTPVTVPAVNKVNASEVVSDIKAISNDFEFMKNKYNLAGVRTHCKKDKQYLISNAKFDATISVEVLANAFNMDKAEFMGHHVLVDSFGELDNERLALLFADDPTYEELTSEELKALDSIPAVLVGSDFFMVFDNLNEMDEDHNGEGLYWQYWYHVWKTFSVSPFVNNAVFIPATPSVTSVTVNPPTATVIKGQSLQLTATVETQNFAPQSVDWSTSNPKVTVTPDGKLTVAKDISGTPSVTVTATSTFDPEQTGTATITVATGE